MNHIYHCCCPQGSTLQCGCQHYHYSSTDIFLEANFRKRIQKKLSIKCSKRSYIWSNWQDHLYYQNIIHNTCLRRARFRCWLGSNVLKNIKNSSLTVARSFLPVQNQIISSPGLQFQQVTVNFWLMLCNIWSKEGIVNVCCSLKW